MEKTTKKQDPEELLASLSAEELSACLVDGRLDLDSVRVVMKQKEKEEAVFAYLCKIKKLNGKDRRWYIRLPDPTRSEGRLTLKAQTREGLIDKIYAWHVKHEGGPAEVTVAGLYAGYVESMSAGAWSVSTQKRNAYIWDHFLAGDEFLKRPLDEIKYTEWDTWAHALIKRHRLTRKEWKNVVGIIGGICDSAEHDGLISDNVFRRLKTPSRAVFRQPPGKPSERRILTVEREIALYNECLSRYRAGVYPTNQLAPLAIIFLCQTGMRPCEVCALRLDDISEEGITISRYFSEKAGEVLEDHTKAGHGSRIVTLTTFAREIIAEAVAYKKERGIKSEYIFMTGPSMSGFYNRLRRTLPVICKAAGIPPQTPYSGRRTFVSSCLDGGVNLKTLQGYVGHLDPEVTIDHYTFDRASADAKREQLDRIRPSVPIVPKPKNIKKTP